MIFVRLSREHVFDLLRGESLKVRYSVCIQANLTPPPKKNREKKRHTIIDKRILHSAIGCTRYKIQNVY